MKTKLLVCFLLTGVFEGVLAVGGYKCTVKSGYGVTNEGLLQNDKDIYPNYWLVNGGETTFTIDRETGRLIGATYPLGGADYTFKVLHKGDKNTYFKALFVDDYRKDEILTIVVEEFNSSREKPFVYMNTPSPNIFTGTCVNY